MFKFTKNRSQFWNIHTSIIHNWWNIDGTCDCFFPSEITTAFICLYLSVLLSESKKKHHGKQNLQINDISSSKRKNSKFTLSYLNPLQLIDNFNLLNLWLVQKSFQYYFVFFLTGFPFNLPADCLRFNVRIISIFNKIIQATYLFLRLIKFREQFVSIKFQCIMRHELDRPVNNLYHVLRLNLSFCN